MKTISVAMFFDEERNYIDCMVYSIHHNCSLNEAQVALLGKVFYDWGE